jgi:hypothetical protein
MRTLQSKGFWPLQSPFENSKVHLRLQLPKWEFTWECEGSFLHTLLHFREHEMWLPSFLLAHNLASPCLGREPKARVTTWKVYTSSHFASSACSWLSPFLFILGNFSISKVTYRVPWKDKSKIKYTHGMTSFLGMQGGEGSIFGVCAKNWDLFY